MKLLTFILLQIVTFSAVACPEAIRFGDPCNPNAIDYSTRGLSIYQDYNDKKCTKPLLYDGVCPDYLNHGCASIGECDIEHDRINKDS